MLGRPWTISMGVIFKPHPLRLLFLSLCSVPRTELLRRLSSPAKRGWWTQGCHNWRNRQEEEQNKGERSRRKDREGGTRAEDNKDKDVKQDPTVRQRWSAVCGRVSKPRSREEREKSAWEKLGGEPAASHFSSPAGWLTPSISLGSGVWPGAPPACPSSGLGSTPAFPPSLVPVARVQAPLLRKPLGLLPSVFCPNLILEGSHKSWDSISWRR